MPRRRVPNKRKILPDPKFLDRVVTKFVNDLMRKGKKSIAERVTYGAFALIEERAKEEPLKTFKKALDNVKPVLEVKSRVALGMRWLITFAKSRGEKTMQEKLAGEIMDAANNRGNAVKKREDTHKMAEANKAFAHYRW